ncbi:MAG TPA: hypothetical protein VFM05_06735 [Candidatus Saccharimonadales bacterium]|nr:hypothetical protein [Candidatus Saccharimonadales bacterium]
MKASKIFPVASATGVLVSVIGAGVFTADVFAWQPKGVIQKSVMNQTTASQLSDANDDVSAVDAKPGDTLKYVIEVRNEAPAHDQGHNDMHFTKLTDTLPAGIELLSDPTKREITEDLGIIKPGEKVTKEYLVKVVLDKNSVIKNEACFTGDSQEKDNPQKGCDNANVKVTIPPKEAPKPETPAPQQPQVKAADTKLPTTGASSFLAPLAAVGSGTIAYVGRLLTLRRRQQ